MNIPGHLQTAPRGINDRGVIVGQYDDGPITGPSSTHGFVFRFGQFSTVDFPGVSFTGVFGINYLGTLVGNMSIAEHRDGRPFRYMERAAVPEQCDQRHHGPRFARSSVMKTTALKILNSLLLSATLLAPLSIVSTARADHHHETYRDDEHHDQHEWNDHEDRAYRMWLKEQHRKYKDFAKLRAEDQRNYWAWRHNHSDAELKIDIR